MTKVLLSLNNNNYFLAKIVILNKLNYYYKAGVGNCLACGQHCNHGS